MNWSWSLHELSEVASGAEFAYDIAIIGSAEYINELYYIRGVEIFHDVDFFLQ